MKPAAAAAIPTPLQKFARSFWISLCAALFGASNFSVIRASSQLLILGTSSRVDTERLKNGHHKLSVSPISFRNSFQRALRKLPIYLLDMLRRRNHCLYDEVHKVEKFNGCYGASALNRQRNI